MSCCENTDLRLQELNWRARLLHKAAAAMPDDDLAIALADLALATASEAATILAKDYSAADHGEAYYHEGDHLLVGWALDDQEHAERERLYMAGLLDDDEGGAS